MSHVEWLREAAFNNDKMHILSSSLLRNFGFRPLTPFHTAGTRQLIFCHILVALPAG